jgi:hypothetical protein
VARPERCHTPTTADSSPSSNLRIDLSAVPTLQLTHSFNTFSITKRGSRSGSFSTRLSLLNSMVSRDAAE